MAATLTLDPTPIRNPDGSFTVTGRISSTAGLNHIAIGESIEGGPRFNFGAATVAADGTFFYRDPMTDFERGDFVATAYLNDKTTVQSAAAPYTFYADGHETTVTSTGEPATSTVFRKGGSRTVTITAGGQTLTSDFFDTFDNGAAPRNTFVFDPGHGLDIVNGFRVGGTDHDTLSFLGSDFGSTPQAQLASVLANAHDVRGGDVVIVDPTSRDKVFLSDLHKGQIAHDPGDIAFHG